LQARQGFCIGSLRLMVRYVDGSELTDMPATHRLPNAPHWLLGMANLHGMLIPVLDPARWFGVERDAAAKSMLLVLGHGADAAGIVIDGLPQRLKYDAAITAADNDCVPDALHPFVTATQWVDSQLWLDLDVQALLGALEQAVAVAH
jgi:chemotaxis signal transduction protein